MFSLRGQLLQVDVRRRPARPDGLDLVDRVNDNGTEGSV
jgi:hypothetical protein